MLLEFNVRDLANITELFSGFIESHDSMTLKDNFYFSIGSKHVLRALPPVHICLPFYILFKTDALVQHGLIPGPVLDGEFFELINLDFQNSGRLKRVLEKLS